MDRREPTQLHVLVYPVQLCFAIVNQSFCHL
jgi:hypothetical protein